MQVVPKWQVIVTFADREIRFWVHDHHLSNVQRKVADLSFSETGLDQPIRVDIARATEPHQATSGQTTWSDFAKFPS